MAMTSDCHPIMGKQPEYEVQQIINQFKEGKQMLYLVKWKGYPHDQNTWEPLAHLRNARDKITSWKNYKKRGVQGSLSTEQEQDLFYEIASQNKGKDKQKQKKVNKRIKGRRKDAKKSSVTGELKKKEKEWGWSPKNKEIHHQEQDLSLSLSSGRFGKIKTGMIKNLVNATVIDLQDDNHQEQMIAEQKSDVHTSQSASQLSRTRSMLRGSKSSDLKTVLKDGEELERPPMARRSNNNVLRSFLFKCHSSKILVTNESISESEPSVNEEESSLFKLDQLEEHPLFNSPEGSSAEQINSEKSKQNILMMKKQFFPIAQEDERLQNEVCSQFQNPVPEECYWEQKNCLEINGQFFERDDLQSVSEIPAIIQRIDSCNLNLFFQEPSQGSILPRQSDLSALQEITQLYKVEGQVYCSAMASNSSLQQKIPYQQIKHLRPDLVSHFFSDNYSLN